MALVTDVYLRNIKQRIRNTMQLTVKLIPAKRRTMKETIFCYLVLFLSGVVSGTKKN